MDNDDLKINRFGGRATFEEENPAYVEDLKTTEFIYESNGSEAQRRSASGVASPAQARRVELDDNRNDASPQASVESAAADWDRSESNVFGQVAAAFTATVAFAREQVGNAMGAIQQQTSAVDDEKEQPGALRAYKMTVEQLPAVETASLLTRKHVLSDSLEMYENSSRQDYQSVMAATEDPVLREMRAAALMSDDWKVAVKSNGVEFENGGNSLFASDSDIITRNGNQTEIEAMVELAKNNGWEAIEFTGSDEFKELAMLTARERGLVVFVPEADRAIADRVVQQLDDRSFLEFEQQQDLAVDDKFIGRSDVVLETESPEALALENKNQPERAGREPVHGLEAFVGLYSRAADEALEELPIFVAKPTDIVSERRGALAPQQSITVVGRTESGDIVGKDGAAFAKISLHAFEEVPKEGEKFTVSRRPDGLDIAQPKGLEQDQELNVLGR